MLAVFVQSLKGSLFVVSLFRHRKDEPLGLNLGFMWVDDAPLTVNTGRTMSRPCISVMRGAASRCQDPCIPDYGASWDGGVTPVPGSLGRIENNNMMFGIFTFKLGTIRRFQCLANLIFY
jgi:hypothetical protein